MHNQKYGQADRPERKAGMYENLDMRKMGHKEAMDDIEEMGIEWTKHMFALRLKCTGVDAWFIVGYGEAIVQQSMRDNATHLTRAGR